jgi:hypothetical protein
VGGTLTISRRIRPSRTDASFAEMSSTCRFVTNGLRGFSSQKECAAKLAKSTRKQRSMFLPGGIDEMPSTGLGGA